MRWWPLVVLLVPLSAAAVTLQQDATVDAASQAAFATLSAGDISTATIGTSQTSATVNVTTLPAVIPDDALDITSTDDTWQVHAELVSDSGFEGALDTITIALTDGVLTETQVIVAVGVPAQTEGLPVDLPTTGDTELTVVGVGTGTIVIDLVLEPDSGGPALRYPVTINV